MGRIKLLFMLLALGLTAPQAFAQAVNVQDSLALVDLYDSTNGPNWSNNSGWKKGPVSTWYGVYLTEGHVTTLILHGNGLSGSLPTSFGNLKNLQDLTLSFNQLSLLPISFGNLSNLQGLDLSYNQLSLLPASFVNLVKLWYLNLSRNQLSALPESFGNLVKLQELYLDFNQLSSLPASFGNLTGLQHLGLIGNKLSSLPNSFGSLVKLEELYLHQNQLNSLPASFGNLKNLLGLALGGNQLSSLPESIGNLKRLQSLDLPNNKFTFAALEWIVMTFTSRVNYAPQGTFKLLEVGHTFVAPVGGTPKNNTLYWYCDNQLDTTIQADSTYTPLKPGRYRVEAHNAIATELTLYSEPLDYLPNCDTCIWVWYRDADGDGWGNPNSTKEATKQPKGYVSNNLDCNDKDKAKGGPEVCDGIDNDCDGIIDDGLTETTFYSDFDGDGYGSEKRTITTCAPPPRYVTNSEDHNDDNAKVYPGAPEICDGRDNNQDGEIDEGFTKTTFYHDFDKDGYGRNEVTLQACAAPLNYVARAGDCNDRDPNIHPGASGPPNDGIDNNCNGLIDEPLRNVVTQKESAVVGEQEPALQLEATPNPAPQYFTLHISSNSTKTVALHIFDAMGRTVEVKQGVAANCTVMLGHSYRPGVYYVEVLQEGKKATLKLVKTAQ